MSGPYPLTLGARFARAVRTVEGYGRSALDDQGGIVSAALEYRIGGRSKLGIRAEDFIYRADVPIGPIVSNPPPVVHPLQHDVQLSMSVSYALWR